MTTTPEFDTVLWGGSSFIGKLVAEHLHQTYGVDGSIRWAIGGIWTPAASIAEKITPRLIENAGVNFELLNDTGERYPIGSVLFGSDTTNVVENQSRTAALQ